MKLIDLRNLTNNLRMNYRLWTAPLIPELFRFELNLINQTESRIENVRKLANDIEECLMNEIRNLNETLSAKNSEIEFILAADKKFM